MAREDLHFRLRIPEELKKRIEVAADKSRRSMTAEIVAALEEAFPAAPPLDERLSEILVTLGTLAGRTEGETPEGVLAKFTSEVVEAFESIRDGAWETDARTREIAAAALLRLGKVSKK